MDCSGKLGRLECGIAVFNHPDNPEHPTSMVYARLRALFPELRFLPLRSYRHLTRKPFTLRYRIFTHIGNVTEGRVAQAWTEYAATMQGIVLV